MCISARCAARSMCHTSRSASRQCAARGTSSSATMAKRVPVRWRLTLWYGGLLALALVGVCGTLYFSLRHELYQALDDGLGREAALALASVTVDQGQPSLDISAISNPREGEQFLRLTDMSGQPVADTGASLTSDVIASDGLNLALRGVGNLQWVAIDGEQLRVLSEPVRVDGHVIGAIQVGAFGTHISETLELLKLLLVVVVPLALVLASGGGLWIAGRALAPVDRLTRLAAAIAQHGEQNLSQRLTTMMPDDEIGRLARTFNAMLGRLDDAFQQQRRFTADAAHEMRTPLALLQSQLEVAIVQERDPTEDQIVFETLADDLGRLTRITSALLALARGDAGELTITRESIDLAELVELVASQYDARAEEEGVAVVAATSPLTIVGDEDLLIQLLVNLIENSLRYSPAGKQITVGCRPIAQGAQLWVADEGRGIAAEHLPHLFERFYRVADSRGRSRASGGEHAGAGLGLSICQLIVTAHGGTIEVASTLDLGTTVTVTLPANTPGPDSRFPIPIGIGNRESS
ncbi:MAG TPA: hypothetical protein DEG70_06040 [Chloroflexi bacterium]|nr:hypothetical protein [Chloroflexota bacterium]